MQELTGSTLQVGLVALFEGIAVLVVGPLGGTIADRVDRRRLVQLAQGLALLTSLALAILSWLHLVVPAHVFVASLLVSALATFDVPARQSLIPALVPRERIVEAIALAIPGRNAALLVGPAIAGALISLAGAQLVYLFDVATYVVLIVTLGRIGFEKMDPPKVTASLWSSAGEGLGYIRRRPLIWQLMAMDLSATFFAGYRVLLPSLARDVFDVGAAGYGLLAGAPAVGGILGSGVAYRLGAYRRKGLLALGATAAYAAVAMALGYVPWFVLAVVLVGLLGLTDTVAQVIRQGVVQAETPNELRGRVTAFYQMVSRGGPALGQAQLGASAHVLGAPLALALGSLVPLTLSLWFALRGRTVREYEG